MASIKVKRGDTFSYTAKWVGAKVTELKSQVRTVGGILVSDVVITASGEADTFLLKVLDTKKWPVGDLVTDIERTSSSGVLSSDTIYIKVTKDVTQS